MRKDLKEKRKKLGRNYSDYLYEVLGYLSRQGLTRYAYYALRDDAIEAVYECQENGDTPKNTFHKGYENHYQKKINLLPKKNVFEKVGSFTFSFFALFFILALFVYIYRFGVKDAIYYSSGIYLYITASSISSMFIYGFLGAIVSIFLQRIDKKSKYIMASITAAIGIGFIILFLVLGANNPNPLKINMMIVLPVCLVLSGTGLTLELLVSKKLFFKK